MTHELQQNVFICYSDDDKLAARVIYRLLSKLGINTWFDEALLVPGSPWKEDVDKAINKASILLYLVGDNPPGNWQIEETNSFLSVGNDPSQIIPVLLPGATLEHLPNNLKNNNYIDLRNSTTDTMMDTIVTGLSPKLIDDKASVETILTNMASSAYTRGDYDTALNYLQQSLAIQRHARDKAGEGTTLNNMATAAHARGDYDTALNYLQQSLAIQRQIGDRAGEGTTLNNISQIFKARGDYDTAMDYLQRSMAI